MSVFHRNGSRWRRRGVVLVALAGVITLTSSAAAPADTPATGPETSITGGPLDRSASNSSTATFTYTSATGANFRCAIDDGVNRPCPASGATYTGLGNGRHTFRVSARVGAGPFGGSATRSWEVDRRPPTVTITAPTSTRLYTAATWAALCDGRGGVCGAAGDTHGVGRVTLAVRNSANKYWSDGTFSSSVAVWFPADGTEDWHLPLALPPDGSYTVFARGTDTLGNETDAAQATRRAFAVDTTPPPSPVFTVKPDDPSTATSFRFTVEPTADGTRDEQRLRCALDTGALRSCGPTFSVNRLALGNHCVRAVGVDPWGNTSLPRTYCWDVIVDHGFTITGTVLGELAPGVSRPVELVIDNPFRFPLKLLTLSTTIVKKTSNTACDGIVNFTATQPLPVAGLVAPPGVSHLTVANSAGRLPVVTMNETHTNQDACIGTTITLTFTGDATKATRAEEQG